MAIRDIIRAALFTPNENGWGLPLAFAGGPGVGKTAIVRQVARECGLACETLSPGERGEGAFGCVPMPRAATDEERAALPGAATSVLTYPLPEWAAPLYAAGRGVVFVDELTTAPPALQPPMLGLFLEKRIGGQPLPRGVRMLAAHNPPDTAANGHELPPPVANRMGHIQWECPTGKAHGDWMLASAGDLSALEDAVSAQGDAVVDPAAEEARVLREWPAAIAAAAGSYATFISRRPDLVRKEPAAHDEAASGPWPSPRTWSFAVRAVAAARVHGLSDEDRDALVVAYVGVGAGSEFIAHLNDESLPDAQAVLDGTEAWEHDPRREDVTMAVLTACCAYTVPQNAERRDARARRFWKILDTVCDAGGKDLVQQAAVRLAHAGHLRHKEARPVLAKLAEVLKEAGFSVK